MKPQNDRPAARPADETITNHAEGADTARLASMIGLCRRAGRLGCGTDKVTGALKTGGVYLVLLAQDPSARTKKVVTDKCAFRSIPLIEVPLTRDALGAACGMASLSACAVTDQNFASAIAALAGHRDL